MVEPTGHCPYLGLKQNRAIRFSSPTPEHRCYIGGEPIEIPVDQAGFCLSRGHVNCPLYMGLTVPTTSDAATAGAAAGAVAVPGGLRGWYATLPTRDRAVYALMLGMLALIVVIYLAAGLQSLRGATADVTATPAATAPGEPAGGATAVAVEPSATPAPASATTAPTETAAPASPTPVPPTPTLLPTSTPAPQPTVPTQATVILVPTSAPTQPAATAAPTLPAATAAPATAAPTQRPATAAPAQPTAVPPTAPPPATRAPTQAPAASVTNEVLWLYFADPSGSLYVPVQRRVRVEDKKVGEAAVRELIAGPRPGLERLVVPDAQLLSLTIADGTAFADFNKAPNGAGDERGLFSIVLTLTHFPSIERVQFLVNGQPHGVSGTGPVGRPVVNPLNPSGLPFDYAATEFLPTYYLTADGAHTVRIVRMVPKTRETAAGTLYALLEGPGDYSYAVQRVIPDGTGLLDVRLDSGVATVNFSSDFAEAGNRQAAVRTVVESLTTLRTISGVRFLVDGQPLGGYWGAEYDRVFQRPLINPE